MKLPPIVKNRNKYEAGYVVGFAGSTFLPGAAKLASLAALKAGAGIVRLFYASPIGEIPFELIAEPWEEKRWNDCLAKASAVFIGPGLGSAHAVQKLLTSLNLPCVIDADALQPHFTYPKQAILTPHRGELLRLLNCDKAPPEDDLFAKITQFCNERDLIVVLKGAPTTIFSPKHASITISRGDPAMAKAGSGDVLTGIIAALLAQGLSALEAAQLGVTLHGIAGEKAAIETTSYCMLASDLITYLPAAFKSMT